MNLLMTSEISVPRGSWIRFNLASGGCWYGHGFSHRQPYPLNAEAIVNTRFAVNNIQSPIWMCSEGYAFLIDTTESLEVRCNEQGDGWLRIMCSETAVTVRVFQGKSLPEAHGQLMKHLHWPPPCPEARMFGDSIFCTWTQHPRAVLQGRVLEMAKAIRQHGFPCSMLTIDDRWESVFGELTFSDDFPDPAGMVRELHEMGFSVLLWTTPFVNQEAASYRELAERGWLAPRYDGSGPALLKWWGGTAGIVDITNPEAKEWYRTRLLRLMDEIGVDGFKIDGGDAKYMPEPSITAWHRNVGPSGYVDLYLSLYEEVAPGKCESRTAWLSQGRNILWREGGKDSHWGVDNGLKAMVNLGLHLALLGYDTLIPDMIPGRVQTMDANTPLPSDELFVRWVEASALMPLMQFSYYPWNYAETTSSIARQYALLHKSLEDYLVEQAFNRSAPLLRPLWYDNPDEADFYSIDDEFLLGNDLLVAPVLEEYQVARDIFLPSGNWRDAWTGELIQEKHLLQYPAPCPGIPIFVRAERKDLLQKIRTALDGIKKGGILSSTKSATYSSGLNRDISVTG
ncbi:MAG: glycoside hydrolase family 31 protein [Chthoniobacterales bacterium]